MTPGGVLLVVAAALYLIECILWVPRGRIALLAGTRPGFRPVEPEELFLVAGGSFAFLFPLPPLGRVVLLDARPLPREGLALEPVAERIAHWRAESSWLRILANAMFVYLFVVCPVIVAFRGLLAAWLPLLAGLVSLESLTVIEYHFAHRALFPHELGARLGRSLLMLASPFACVRAEDGISREVLSPAHPLVACVLLCDPRSAARYARRILYDAGYLDAGPADDIARLLDEILAAAGLSLELLRAKPEATDSGVLSFCPRCHAQYVPEHATCTACNVETRPLAAPGR